MLPMGTNKKFSRMQNKEANQVIQVCKYYGVSPKSILEKLNSPKIWAQYQFEYR